MLGAPDLTTIDSSDAPVRGDRLGYNSAGPLTVDQRSGRLFALDINHNRVLSWPDSASFTNGQTADVVIGQTSLTSGDPGLSASTLHTPGGLAVDRLGNLYVADTANHRVLIFRPPFSTGMAATMVLGEDDFVHNDREQPDGTEQNSFNSPSGLACDEAGNLWVCDTQNSRVVFYEAPLYNDAVADAMLGHSPVTPGQFNWTGYYTNDPSAEAGFYWPQGVAVSPDGSRLAIADHYNHRVVIYALNTTARPWGTVVPGQSAAAAIGQSSTASLGGRNREDDPGYEFGDPHADTLRFPMAVAYNSRGDLLIADTDNSRVLVYPPASNAAGVALAANRVFGQVDLDHKEYPDPTPTSLYSPTGVAVDGMDNVLVSDQTNDRILRYDQPYDLGRPVVTTFSPKQVLLHQASPRTRPRLFIGTGYTRKSRLADGTVPEFWGGRLFARTDAAALGAGNLSSEVLPGSGSNGGSGLKNQTGVVVRPGDTSVDGVLGQSGTAASGQGAGDIGQVTVANGGTHHLISAANLESPAAVAVNPVDGRVFVADRVNHRVLGWTSANAREAGSEADIVIGQPDFFAHLPNQGAAQPSYLTLNAPSGLVCSPDGRLYVADTGNNRVLEYRPPFTAGMGASVYWGQTGTNTGLPNRGGSPTGETLSQPTALTMDSAFYLAIADTGNNRVLVIKPPRELQLQPPVSPLPAMAVEVYGQPDYTHGTANNGGVSAHSLSGPKGVAFLANKSLWIGDSANNRVLYIPAVTRSVFGQNAALVLGQDSFTAAAVNRGGSAGPRSLSAPAGLASDRGVLAVADQGNQRVLLFRDPSPDAEDDSADLTLTQTAAAESVAFGSDHSLWVAYPLAGRVLRWMEPLPAPFTVWNLGHFTDSQWLDAGTGDRFADPDHDEQTNLLEYAFGTNPAVPNAQPWPAIDAANARRVLFPYDPARTDIALHIERSANLTQWTGVFDSSAPSTATWGFQGGNGYWIDPAPPAGATRLFYRVSITLLP